MSMTNASVPSQSDSGTPRRVYPWGPYGCTHAVVVADDWPDPKCRHRTQKDDLVERERDLLTAYRDVWAPPLRGVTLHWRRGFIASVACTRAAWLACEACLFWHPKQNRPCPATAQPVEQEKLRGGLAALVGLDLGRWPGVKWATEE